MQPPLAAPPHPRLTQVLAGKRSWYAVAVLSLLALGIYFLARNAAGHANPTAAPFDGPVILLTGFEPFGKEKNPNPSWEGIKGLDGKEWHGYRLVCKQMRCVWGFPMEQLQGWIAEYQPVAVFSFGQGANGAFALETKTSNLRGNKTDNQGEKPSAPTTVEGGPEFLQASTDCQQLASLLSAKGHHTRVSTNPGRYLCAETLYCLEYMKSTGDFSATVLFCHVPKLDTEIQGKKVTAEYVQEFVQDLLASWLIMAQAAQPKAEDARRKEIKDFVNRYFRTWSEQDMKGYDSCFMRDAAIQYIDAQGKLSTQARKEFVASQADYHKNAPQKTTEVPESIDIQIEAKLARVVVYWKLTAGTRVERGYDHFTLMKLDGSWRIVNLVFYPSAKKITD